MARKIIGGAYSPSHESRGLRDAKGIVDRISGKHGYFVEHGKSGRASSAECARGFECREAWGKEDWKWGASRLFKIMEALGGSNGEGYHEARGGAALLSASLNQLVGAARAARTLITPINSMN